MLTRKDLFMALANDEEFETLVDDVYPNVWYDVTTEKLLDYLSKYPTAQNFPYIRVKSKNVTKTVTFPEPMRTAPEIGQMYWVIDCDVICGYAWENTDFDNDSLLKGLIHYSEENAKLHLAAIESVKYPFTN